MRVALLLLSLVALFRAQTAVSLCSNVQCLSGYSCVDGGCYQVCNPASGGATPQCPAGYICQTSTVGGATSSLCVVDPCRSCPAGSVCDATTGNRCVANMCANVQCPAPTQCDANTGRCYCTATTGCPTGQSCIQAAGSTVGYCASDPCAAVTCTSPSTCVNGACVTPTTQCSASVPCPTGLLCSQNGVCSTCSSALPCPAGSICSSTGHCVTDPCGGRCTTTQTCVVDSTPGTNPTGTCTDRCSANLCPTGKMCVGDLCVTDLCATVRCEAGTTCINGQCSPLTCSSSQASCPTGTSCRNGVCTNVCAAITCLAPSTCDSALGQCVQPICTADVKECPTGEFVSRVPSLNCDFAPCPDSTCSDANCPRPSTCLNGRCVCGTAPCATGTVCTAHQSNTGSALTVSCDPIACPLSIVTCPDGTIIRPDANCQLAPCPTSCNVACPPDTICRSGTCVKTCGTTTCLATEECSNGACVPPTSCPAGCPIGTTCTNGRCLCNGVVCSSSQICYPDLTTTQANPTYACREPCAGNPCANNADGLTTCVPAATSASGYICACATTTTSADTGALAGSATVCSGCNGNTCPPPDPCSRCLTAGGQTAECSVRDGNVFCNLCGNCPTGTTCELSSTGVYGCKASSPCEPNPCTRYTSSATTNGLFAPEVGVCRVGADGTAQCYYGSTCSSLRCPNGCVETVVAGTLAPVAQCITPDVCANVVCQRPGSVCVPDSTLASGYSCVDPCDPNPCLGFPCTTIRDSTGLVRPACSIPTTEDPCATATCAAGTVCKVDASAPNRFSCVRPTDPCANSPCGTNGDVVCVSATAGTLSSVGGYACVRPCSATTCRNDQVCQLDSAGNANCVDPMVCPQSLAACPLFCGTGIAPVLVDNCRCGCPTPVDPPVSVITTTYTFTGELDFSLLNRIGELLNSAVAGQIVVTVTASAGSTTITVQQLSSDPNATGVTPEQIAAAVESASASSSSSVVGSASSGSLISLF